VENVRLHNQDLEANDMESKIIVVLVFLQSK
jgi:hypothetical protein